jgi:hypothetical protein
MAIAAPQTAVDQVGQQQQQQQHHQYQQQPVAAAAISTTALPVAGNGPIAGALSAVGRVRKNARPQHISNKGGNMAVFSFKTHNHFASRSFESFEI